MALLDRLKIRHGGSLRPRLRPLRRSTDARCTTNPARTYLGEDFTQWRPAAEGGGPAREGAATITVRSLNHAAVPVSDVAASAKWYIRVLGFELMPRPNFPFGGAWLSAGSTTIHIIAADPTAPPVVSSWLAVHRGQESVLRRPEAPQPWWTRRARHLAFQVDDLNAAEQALQAHGVAYDKFEVPGSGAFQLFLFDPDGNGIELGDYAPIAASLEG